MMTVVIEARAGQEEALGRTLHSLVGGAVEGVVREVIVAAASDAGDIAKVADHTGCRVAESLAAAVQSAKGDWLLLLEPGARLLDGWIESALDHVASGKGPARFRSDGSIWRRLAAWPALHRRPFAHGLLISRRQALAAGLPPHTRPKLSARITPAL